MKGNCFVGIQKRICKCFINIVFSFSLGFYLLCLFLIPVYFCVDKFHVDLAMLGISIFTVWITVL